jgi:hypothetical protein
VGAGNAVKQIVKAAVLLNDDDDALNLGAGCAAVDSLQWRLHRLLIREW